MNGGGRGRIRVALVAGLLLLAACGRSPASPAIGRQPTVAILQFVRNPALDQVHAGILAGLADSGYALPMNAAEGGFSPAGSTGGAGRIPLVIRDFNANNDAATAAMMARQIAGEAPDLVIAIATPAAQAVAQAGVRRPLLFSAVFDPISAGLVDSLERPGRPITGVSSMMPVQAQIDLAREFQPDLRRLGVTHNPTEPNSRSYLALLEQAAAARSIRLVAVPVENATDAGEAILGLAGRVDAVFMPMDNSMASGFASLLQACRRARLPLYTADGIFVPRGAVASVSVGMFEVGRRTGQMAARILAGGDPATMPVEKIEDNPVLVNDTAARAFGLRVPARYAARP